MPKAKSNLSRKTARARTAYNLRRNKAVDEISGPSTSRDDSHPSVDNVHEEISIVGPQLPLHDQEIENAEVLPMNNVVHQSQIQPLVVSSRGTFGFKSAFAYNPLVNYLEIKFIQIGAMDKICSKCGAKRWKDEASGLCCAGGKVSLPLIQDPPELFRSLITDHRLSNHFLNNVRQYNALFQMTSFGCKEVREGNYMPTFKIQGQVYHLIGSLLPHSNESHQFLQIYFLSDADQISTRSNINPSLKRELIESLQQSLQEHNHLIRSFKYNLENRAMNTDENLKLIIHADRVPSNEHRGRYNAPTTNEVAVLLVDEDKGPRDIVLQSRSGDLQRVSEIHRAYDSLQYPLLFIRGEDGYYVTIPQQNNSNRFKTVSCMQFYAYRLMIRGEVQDNYLHHFRNLFNQYLVDMMAKMISERLSYIRHNQTKLRADEYIHLRDALNQDADVNPRNIGQSIILPSSFTGGPRFMHEKTQDAMVYVRNFGRPDLFVTFTCNPDWPEIKKELFAGQVSSHRHDITSRVFHLKLKKLMNLLTKKNIFGIVECHMYSVEWQKRGLPHAHILLWLRSKIQPDEIDKIISAELPDRQSHPQLYDIVCKNMIHGPCGALNPTSPCMVNGRCSKRYPRQFITETQTGDDGYPTYRRRSPENGGATAILTSRNTTFEVDNRWVVPYCPMLSRCFVAHINIEYCHSVQAIKYICKYINKGSDQATFSINKNSDEINNYINGRYICTSEAVWRFLEFPIHERYPTVVHLAVHLQNHQRVYFSEVNIQQVAETPRTTTLTAFFDLCQSDEFARTLLYYEVPHYYTWSNNTFSRRQRGQHVEGYPGVKRDAALGRVYTIHPNQTECFHLRMLLHHVQGPSSFESLRTVNGVLQPTYKAACQLLGLLENDDQWKDTLTDAAISQTPSKLRDLFAIILVFCQPSQPLLLWQEFQTHFCEDILYRQRQIQNDYSLTYSDNIFNQGLIQIEDKVVSLCEKYLTDFSLPSPVRDQNISNDPLDDVYRHTYDANELRNFVDAKLPTLVPDQRVTFDIVIKSVSDNKGDIFFLDAPGGTGKTFLMNLILAKVRSTGGMALAVASSGIAATLLTGGRTAHSTFKLPLNVTCEQDFVCHIRKNSRLGKIMQETTLIVWDECTMSHKAHIEAIDRTLKDLRSSGKLMGGVTFVFSGDFRQTLPVIPKGTRADIVRACLKSSRIWNDVTTLHLRTNMRAHLGGGNSQFPIHILKIGNGEIANDDNYISIDDKVGKIVHTIEDMISNVYPDIQNLHQKPYVWLCERAIISPRNITAQEINDNVLKKFDGETREYRAIDTVVNTEDAVHYPQEFLNSLTPAGFPPYNLALKVGAPIMLLRNLNPPILCNGTRLQIKVMRNHIIEATILTGPAAGEIAFIPRIPMIPTDLPFQFKRLQFPIKVSFAITINKSQGQTFKYVGVDLRSECFSHGQLYVALSRTGNPDNQFILVPNSNITRNVVYPEIF